ncbi:hypothetical protein [Ovoidimarina sediminis]|uniref:hypothetical protein n=1 Tax=Ovoidimarina sediminis TaxID=3079856 RepID=UPI002907C208|nr:hypothetical protein [Rhodophyticola sp. MJ-SS7]MDU8945118.1 hypothetical protein [Rhodophyticola sp. MJ-SS7]
MRVREISSPFKGDVAFLKFGGGSNNLKLLEFIGSSGLPVGYHVDAGGGDDEVRSDSTANDRLIGGDGSDLIAGGLGHDEIYLGDTTGADSGKGKSGFANAGFGETDGTLTEGGTGSAPYVAGNDFIDGGDGGDNRISGDFEDLVVTNGGVVVAGDEGDFRPGLDGGNNGTNTIAGDAMSVTMVIDSGSDLPSVTFGNDSIDGGIGSTDLLVGDAITVTFEVAPEVGDDVTPSITGGNDRIEADGISSVLIGDFGAVTSTDHAVTVTGGDDTLVSSPNDDILWGDVRDYSDLVTVIGGADTFVFDGFEGNDTIMDFELGKDRIEVGDDVEDWEIEMMLLMATQEGTATVLDLALVGGSGTVRVENTWDGVDTSLTLSDFGVEMIA